MNQLLSLPGCVIERVETDEDKLVVTASTERSAAFCPGCGQLSHLIHSRYLRTPSDLPVGSKQVRLHLRVRRFRCSNAVCQRHTFSEPLPDLLALRARRTIRLTEAQKTVGNVLGGEAGARLLRQLFMPVSSATLLRLIRCQTIAPFTTLRVLGVDDWAIRKGHTYGTILVDLEQRRVVDLLEDRTSETLATWLKKHPSIEIIARDRSTEYAKGANEGAPQAQQVADRWHLLVNVTQMVERFISGVHARLRQRPYASTPEEKPTASPVKRQAPFPRTKAEEERRQAHRQQRLQLFHQVKERFEAGESISAISRTLKLTRSTVRKYACAESFPERSEMALKPSILDPYLDYLTARHAQGCECASTLWREILQQGFPGSRRQVAKWMRVVRRTPAPSTPGTFREAVRLEKARLDLSKQSPAPAKLPSARQLAWLLAREPATLQGEDVTTLARVLQDAEVAHVHTVSRGFIEMVRQQDASRLDEWLETASTSSVTALRTFALGIKQDYSAVRAALATPWSNGQTEGQVTKLKLIKRTMYGRANFDLLRQRVLLAA